MVLVGIGREKEINYVGGRYVKRGIDGAKDNNNRKDLIIFI